MLMLLLIIFMIKMWVLSKLAIVWLGFDPLCSNK